MNGRIRIGTEIDTSEFDKQLKYLRTKSEDIKTSLNDNKLDFSLRIEYEAELERVENAIKRFENRQIKLSLSQIKNIEYESTPFEGNSFSLQRSSIGNNFSSMSGDLEYICDQFSDIHEEAKNVSDEISKSEKNTKKLKNQTANINLADKFEKSTSSIKRFALSLLSIGTIWGVLSKASSAYLATDEKTTKQMEANWVGLGTILEPVITGITNMMKKAVTGILYFISCLTGTDYIAKANAAALKKQTKATNELAKANQRATGSFDEMDIFSPNNTISSNSTSDDNSLPLFSANDLSENVKKTLAEIAEVVKPIYDFLKDLIGWTAQNPEVVVGILGGLSLLSFLKKVIGNNTSGLTGISGLLSGLAAVTVITICVEYTIKNYEQIQGALEKYDNKRQTDHETTLQHIDDLKEEALQLEKGSDAFNEHVKALDDEIESNRSLAVGQQEVYRSRSNVEKITDSLMGRESEYKKSIMENVTEMYKSTMAMKDLYDTGKLSEEQTKSYQESLILLKQTLKETGVTFVSTGKEGIETFEGYMTETDNALFELQNNLPITQGCFKNLTSAISNSFNSIANGAKDSSSLVSGFKKIIQDIKFVIDDTEMQDARGSLREGIFESEMLSDLFSKFKIKIDNQEVSGTKTKLDDLTDKLDGLDMTKTIQVGADLSKFKTILSNYLNGSFKNVFTNVMGTLGITLKFPQIKLASGAIVNNPGHGVPYGGTLRGEAGKEGVLPLTNSTTMAELGREIGKWITINQTNNTYLDGRLINRQLVRTANETSFVTNGRR